jgi:hypothetical protein
MLRLFNSNEVESARKVPNPQFESGHKSQVGSMAARDQLSIADGAIGGQETDHDHADQR